MKVQNNLKMVIYNAILEGILHDEYKPNQILNEQELVAKYGYSKSPIREALITLCNEGILRNLPRYGYEVVKLTREDAEQIMEFRLVLESGYLESSMKKITSEKINSLEAIFEDCKEDTEDLWEHWEANTKFHLRLLSFSENTYAVSQLERTMCILKRAYAQFHWSTWSTAIPSADVKNHGNIIEALRNRDLESTLRFLREDLRDFCI